MRPSLALTMHRFRAAWLTAVGYIPMRLKRLVALFFTFTITMMLLKPVFMLAVGGYRFAEIFPVMYHGFAMDCTVAGYFTVLPALAAIASVWCQRPWLERAVRIYLIVIAVFLAIVTVVDAALYPYWGFRLDTTPLFYFTTSPSAAVASMEWYHWILGPVAIAALSFGFAKLFTWVAKRLAPKGEARHRRIVTVVLTVATAALFIPIRGGFTVSTMNLSRAYFSNDMRLNQAAINPVFSLLYSLTHSADFDRFKFYDPTEAEAEVKSLKSSGEGIRLEGRPNVLVIVLESFSAHLLPSLGGEPIATNLDAIAREGWSFTDIYASSIRTDRALPAVLNGLPAQPTTSLLKYVNKLTGLPAMASTLRSHGYATTYYYGGDINFANINALLVAGGFDRIIKDKDFPASLRGSKWGVHDGPLFEKAADELCSKSLSSPWLAVVQTSSSHEPFEVPYNGGRGKRANAFEYTDRELGRFFDRFEKSPQWANTLVVIVPDHYGAYPEGLDDPISRHHIPLIFTGGAIDGVDLDEALLSRTGSQTDITATVLGMLGIDHSDFPFSNDLTDPTRQAFAFFSEPSWFGIKQGDEFARMFVDADREVSEASPEAYHRLKSYIQYLYHYLDKL